MSCVIQEYTSTYSHSITYQKTTSYQIRMHDVLPLEKIIHSYLWQKCTLHICACMWVHSMSRVLVGSAVCTQVFVRLSNLVYSYCGIYRSRSNSTCKHTQAYTLQPRACTKLYLAMHATDRELNSPLGHSLFPLWRNMSGPAIDVSYMTPNLLKPFWHQKVWLLKQLQWFSQLLQNGGNCVYTSAIDCSACSCDYIAVTIHCHQLWGPAARASMLLNLLYSVW